MIDIIIPVHNLARRGLSRVYYSCYSLLKQADYIDNIYVINSSKDVEFFNLDSLLKPLDKVKHIRLKLDTFNKPKLLNHGLRLGTSEYVLFTDADYIFKNDLLKTCKKLRSDKRILLKEVKMLPHINISTNLIDNWKFPPSPFNSFGKIADGALQYAKREWFIKVGGYDERMALLCGMDNDMHARAVRDGLEDKWVVDSEILHQFHRIEVGMKTHQQAKKNWRLIDSDKSIIRNA